ncbi:MAG: 16S rRNA processing protein RimM [Clostridiales bacterium]|nr:16S rRNA processing protein RimM [Clostridiales bacterium]
MDKIHIATILKPQGLKGELKCKLENQNFDVIKNVTEVYLNEKTIPTRVVNKSFRVGYLYLTLSMCDSREKADLMRNFKIYADRKFLQIPEDEYMISDMIGSLVYDQNGNEIGKLLDVQNYGATDILVIEQYKREYLVPFIKDIVKKVNASAKIIVVDKNKYDEAKICE